MQILFAFGLEEALEQIDKEVCVTEPLVAVPDLQTQPARCAASDPKTTPIM